MFHLTEVSFLMLISPRQCYGMYLCVELGGSWQLRARCFAEITQKCTCVLRRMCWVVCSRRELRGKLPHRPEGFDHFQTEALNAGLALRSWAPHILQADPSARHQVEQVLRWVDDCMTKVSPMGICARQSWGHHIYESVFMLQCLLMSRSLRSTCKFKLAIKQVVSLVCPWDIAQSVNCLLDAKEIVLLDRTTLSRFHLVADVALMLYQRSRNSQADRASSPPARYMMADSSTQVGTDWMVSCYTEVAGEDLLPLSDGLDRLMGLRKTSSVVGHI